MSAIKKIKSFIKQMTFILLIIGSILYSQDNCDVSSFKINEKLFNDHIVTYYLSAIDINSGTSYIPLFEYSITGDQNCYALNDSLNLVLEFSMNIFSPAIGFNSYQELFNREIKLSNVSSEITFNNMDLNYSTTSVSGADFSLSDYSGLTDINSDDYQLIVSSILNSGKIPNGLYTFDFKLKTENNNIINEINRTINVNEPEYINLISPGGSMADTLNNIEYSIFPVFTWSADNCSSCETQIRVCEFNPSEHSSPEEAINDIPSLPNVSGYEYYNINDNMNSFQYPTANVKNLEPGKLYAWQLKRLYQSTLGNQEILSQIYVFKIFNTYENQNADNLEIIKLLIGEQKYNELFLEDGVLSGYNSLEGTIILNGSEVSISELNQIINQIQNGIVNIQDIIVE